MSEAILARTAALIERPGGWHQGRYAVGLVQTLCLEDALAVADGAVQALGHTLSPAGLEAYQAIRAELGPAHVGPLWAWQDEAGRTPEEVAALVRNAKRQLRTP